MTFRASITDANVDHFMNLLERAESDGDRSRFRNLLVAEVDRYAQFDLMEHRRGALDLRIASCKDKIARQSDLINEMRDGGLDLNGAETLMTNLIVVHDTLLAARILRLPDPEK